MTIYYNEFDPFAAAMLRNLIAAGHIAPGVVDTRSIEDVRPSDLAGFTQCHFFAGVGVWSHALRRAGWPDERPVWTGSCPCQPFSAAGEGAGFADERHLWPAFHHLIKECGPAIVLGEQVASKDADPWIDLVHTDMEALGYAFGAIPFPSAGVGAPHIRDRLYWCGTLADANDARLEGRRVSAKRTAKFAAGAGGMAGGLAHTNGRDASAERQQRSGEQRQQPQDGGVVRLADAERERRERGQGLSARGVDDGPNAGRVENHNGLVSSDEAGVSRIERAGPTNGFWRDADWLGCTDGKWRPVEPGTFPLAHGAAARVGRLRAYGNAVNAEAALAWIVAVMESRAA